MSTRVFIKIIRSIAALSIIFLLIGCGGGGGGGGSSTPTPTTYKLFPDGYFTAGYQESFNLTGTDTAGGKFTGTDLLKTEAPTTFNGEQAIPVTGLISLTNTVNKVTITQTGVDYFSVDANNRVYLGYENNTYGDTTIGTSLSALPQSAAIGAFGEIGTFNYSNGDTETPSWRVTQAGNGLANFILSTVTIDNTGNITSTEEDTYVIDKDGNRHSIKMVFYSADDEVTVTLSGQ